MIALGWLYWKIGFESVMLAHIMVDAVNFVVVIPAYIFGGTLVRLTVLSTLPVAALGAWHLLAKPTRSWSGR